MACVREMVQERGKLMVQLKDSCEKYTLTDWALVEWVVHKQGVWSDVGLWTDSKYRKTERATDTVCVCVCAD